MPDNDHINSEVKTKTLYRNIAYTGWILFIVLLVFWVFGAINGSRVVYGLVISGVLGGIFTTLMARKKIPDEPHQKVPI